MTVERASVGVVISRRDSASPWVDAVWCPVAVLPDVPDIAPWTEIAAGRFYAGAVEIALHRDATGYYRDNLASGDPRLWVAARAEGERPRIVAVTADPAEGESFTEAGDDIVEAVPMPGAVAGWVAAFVAANHVERPFVKRRRRDWTGDEPDEQA